MSRARREAVLRRFRRERRCSVFLMSLKAGGLGLNLTEASAVVLVDPWWNPAVEEQAVNRVHRLGQRRDVEVVRLVVRDSVERGILALQDKKRALADAAVGGLGGAAAANANKLKLEDLKQLFR